MRGLVTAATIYKKVDSSNEKPDKEGSGQESKTNETNDETNTDFVISVKPFLALKRILKTLHSRVSPEQHFDILHRGILTGLVGQFEVLISDIAHQFYRSAPAAIGTQEKNLTIADLLSFNTIEEAVDYIISDRVDELLRGSADEWNKFFQTRLKVDMAKLSPDWDRFNECIQRRHIIVHAGGRISRRYLKNVKSEICREYFGECTIGQIVKMNDDYIIRALTLFEVTGLLLAVESWAKLRKGEGKEQANLLVDIIYDSMMESRWEVVLNLSEWGSRQAQFNLITRVVCNMNYWLSLKRLGRWSECQEAVRSFDTSAFKPAFALAQASLLDNADDFFAILDATDGADLDEQGWKEWPIFLEMRRDKRFEEYFRKYYLERAPQPAEKIQIAEPAPIDSAIKDEVYIGTESRLQIQEQSPETTAFDDGTLAQ